ncbi:1,4-alpha-glucan branching protein [Streptomyces sp. NPDC093225]|uniref:maltokinase N-terminal cap-like domain-containing protein n=1 Tax=Streptomyces sp. NPDC093225 TaxID=3366034 RepID=UPI00381121B3
MAVIHHTTMSPTKTELLAAWLPVQPWYAGDPALEPLLTRVGGFRLDDPEGEVGMEFMAVADASGPEPVVYHVPMTYRGAPLDGAEAALIGTSEHGVLGTRWIYDGAQDPVLTGQLRALFEGRAVAQAQSLSDTPDPTVVVRATGAGAGPGDGAEPQVVRVLGAGSDTEERRGHVAAAWRLPSGPAEFRGVFAVLAAPGA